MNPPLKPVEWIASSLDDLKDFNALGSDVEIRAIAKPESDSQAKTRVIAI